MNTPNRPSQDWFVSAIVTDGTVGACLNQVLAELRRKESFIAKIKSKISEKEGSNVDAVSEISARISVLENTLKFRLSILSPDRRGAWFRTSSSTASGPFAGSLLLDPVFSAFDESQSLNVRRGLEDCWNKRNLVSYPLKPTETCLWKILLGLNFELHALGDFGEWPRLEKLPEQLPEDFESRSLRAFLSNVKLEYLSARDRLTNVYQTLLEASDRFWAKQMTSTNRYGARNHERDPIYDGYSAAENVREDFRRRRATPTIKRPIGKSAQDLEALQFMGFSDFPDEDSLKQRYHSLALSMHPDRQGGNESRFKQLAKSYKHLRRHCI